MVQELRHPGDTPRTCFPTSLRLSVPMKNRITRLMPYLAQDTDLHGNTAVVLSFSLATRLVLIEGIRGLEERYRGKFAKKPQAE